MRLAHRFEMEVYEGLFDKRVANVCVRGFVLGIDHFCVVTFPKSPVSEREVGALIARSEQASGFTYTSAECERIRDLMLGYWQEVAA